MTRALVSGGLEAAGKELDRLVSLFPGRVHVELQRHLLRGEEHANRALLDLARARAPAVLATNGVRYARRRDKDLFDALTCIRRHTHLDAAGTKLQAGRERHLKTAADMQAPLRGSARASSRSARARVAARRSRSRTSATASRYRSRPARRRRRTCVASRGRARAGASARSDEGPGAAPKELGLIEKLDLAGYFLIVWDIVNFCRKRTSWCRGAARPRTARSATRFAHGGRPREDGLLFERFLSEERGEWPDIDLDLPSGDQRERVIQHVYKTYGAHGAAMTANVITYRDRSAAREMAKAVGFAPDQIDTLAKHLGRYSSASTATARATSPPRWPPRASTRRRRA